MAEGNTYQDRIEEYVLGEMTPEQRTAFEREIAENPQLKKELEDFKQLQEDLVLLDEADFLADMQAIGEELREDPPAYPEARPFRRRWYIAAAAAILLLLIPTFLLLRPSPDNRLFNEYFKAYPDVTSSRTGDAATFNAAMEAYRAGDYADALPHFSDFLSTHSQDAEALFYGGIAEAKAGDPETAIQRFEKLESIESIFLTAAKWFHALALVKSGKREAAIPLLEELSQSDNKYQSDAKALLEEIRAG